MGPYASSSSSSTSVLHPCWGFRGMHAVLEVVLQFRVGLGLAAAVFRGALPCPRICGRRRGLWL
eukprot:1881733-Pyramimonas_sp.AAC.1